MWWGIHDGMGWWMAFAGIWMLLFWGPLIALAVWGIINISRGKEHPGQREDPLETAQRRYTRGEITREQFEEIKATLREPAIRN